MSAVAPKEEPRPACAGCEALLLLLEDLGFVRADLELLHEEGVVGVQR